MALVPRLDLRHVQTLIMTPQLQQAIKLLQLTNLELSEYLERELEQNPLLEREDTEGGDSAPEQGADHTAESNSGDGQDETPDSTDFVDDGFDQPDSVELTSGDDISGGNDASLDTDYENVWNSDGASDSLGGAPQDGLHWQVGGGGGFDEGDIVLESAEAGEVSLRDHLIGQINVDLNDPIDRMIAVHLVDLLDDSGYLMADLDEAAEALGCTQERVLVTLDRIQRFDPPGIFARSLSECLALQLRDLNRFDPAMQALVENLDCLGRREFSALKKICGVEGEDLVDMVAEIKALNPKPAQA